ncbi:MAG: choice-of-anchor C family protein [Acidobacteriota bacterium]|nr:choice-of-anchor C family protein [Acidobacteriota bacterium]
MRRIFILTVIVAALLATAALSQGKAAAKPENLVVNGGFEQGVDPGGFLGYSSTGNKLPGWTVAKGSVDVIGTYFKCSHGRCLDLNGSVNGTIRQTIATEAGKKYRVSFALSANPQCGDPKKVLRVSTGKESTQSKQFVVTGKPTIPWVRRTWDFTADADKTPLTFASIGKDSACGPMLDDIAVVGIAESESVPAK